MANSRNSLKHGSEIGVNPDQGTYLWASGNVGEVSHGLS